MPSSGRRSRSCLLAAVAVLALTQCDRPAGSPTSELKKPKRGQLAAEPAVEVSVEIRSDGLAYRPGEVSPFTGEAVELHPGLSPAVAMRRVPYVDGKKHGSVTRWTPKGKMIEDRQYENGVPKQCFTYHSNGQKKIHVLLNAQDKAEGPYFRWHDNGVLQVESGFDAEERFHGEEKIYDREGRLAGHYRNEHGVFKEVIFETPEEKEHRLAHWAALEAAAAAAAPAAPPPPKDR